MDTLRTMDGNEIRLWMLFRDMQQGRSYITPDQRQIAEMLGTAQSSISWWLKVLRALRVIALLPQMAKSRRERQRTPFLPNRPQLTQYWRWTAFIWCFCKKKDSTAASGCGSCAKTSCLPCPGTVTTSILI